MKLNILSFLILCFLTSNSYAGKYKNFEQWEKCRDKAESSVDWREVGQMGVEGAVKTKCGSPPAQEPNMLTGGIGVAPYDLVRSKAFKNKFAKLTKKQYQMFVDRLTVASETTLESEWIVGNGNAPHLGGSDEAAFAMNSKTGEILAGMMVDGKFIKFGFNSWDEAPKFLREWQSR
jgi:hypothetical protein